MEVLAQISKDMQDIMSHSVMAMLEGRGALQDFKDMLRVQKLDGSEM